MHALRIAAYVFVVIFVAELPDKTALAALVLATRRKALPVFLGSSLALTVQSAIAVLAGRLLSLLPERAVHYGAGAVFFVSAAVMWVRKEEEDEEAGDTKDGEASGLPASALRDLATSFGVVFVAEWGDLTQFATAAFATREHAPWVVFVAATLALWCVTGHRGGHRPPGGTIARPHGDEAGRGDLVRRGGRGARDGLDLTASEMARAERRVATGRCRRWPEDGRPLPPRRQQAACSWASASGSRGRPPWGRTAARSRTARGTCAVAAAPIRLRRRRSNPCRRRSPPSRCSEGRSRRSGKRCPSGRSRPRRHRRRPRLARNTSRRRWRTSSWPRTRTSLPRRPRPRLPCPSRAPSLCQEAPRAPCRVPHRVPS